MLTLMLPNQTAGKVSGGAITRAHWWHNELSTHLAIFHYALNLSIAGTTPLANQIHLPTTPLASPTKYLSTDNAGILMGNCAFSLFTSNIIPKGDGTVLPPLCYMITDQCRY